MRYAIWLTLAYTANANRRHFRLPTTWVPHLAGNSISLLLPEIYRLIDGLVDLEEAFHPERHPTASALRHTIEHLVVDNPDYVEYVASAALAYCVSHPNFNIYRGEWAELKIAGFGLDTIPHATTAYALARLIYDAIDTLEHHLPRSEPLHAYARWAKAHQAVVAGAVLAVLTLGYEAGEYLMRESELEARDHDVSQINMMWSFKDSVFDALSNTIGWALATVRRSR